MRAALLALASRLRFPWLLAVTAVLFVASLVLPDPLPLVDELVLGLLTLLFASWRRRNRQPEPARPAGEDAGER